MIPLTEGLAVRRALREGVSYGQPRAIGSAAFMLSNVVCGLLLVAYPPVVVVIWVIAAAWAAFGASFFLPYEPTPDVSSSYGTRTWSAFRYVFTKPSLFMVLLIGALIQGSHGFYYGFSALVWQQQGISEAMIGRLWACGILAEIAFLIVSRPIGRKIGAKGLVLLGGAAAVLRWWLLGMGPTGLELYAIQAMHLFTFACTHLGVLVMIDQRARDGAISVAQTLNSSISYGLFLGLTTLMSGWLFKGVGAEGYWVMGAIAGVGLFLALFLEPQAPSQKETGDDEDTASDVPTSAEASAKTSVTP